MISGILTFLIGTLAACFSIYLPYRIIGLKKQNRKLIEELDSLEGDVYKNYNKIINLEKYLIRKHAKYKFGDIVRVSKHYDGSILGQALTARVKNVEIDLQSKSGFIYRLDNNFSVYESQIDKKCKC